MWIIALVAKGRVGIHHRKVLALLKSAVERLTRVKGGGIRQLCDITSINLASC